jgi:hypothetical protein
VPPRLRTHLKDEKVFPLEAAMTTILLIVVLVLLFGGGGYYGFNRWR